MTFYEKARDRLEANISEAIDEYVKDMVEAVTGTAGDWVDREAKDFANVLTSDVTQYVKVVGIPRREMHDEKGNPYRSAEGHLVLQGAIHADHNGVNLPSIQIVLDPPEPIDVEAV